MKGLKNQIMKKTSLFICTLLFITSIVFYPKITFAYPFWAQQNKTTNPQEKLQER